jgi:hypothetical protein
LEPIIVLSTSLKPENKPTATPPTTAAPSAVASLNIGGLIISLPQILDIIWHHISLFDPPPIIDILWPSRNSETLYWCGFQALPILDLPSTF